MGNCGTCCYYCCAPCECHCLYTLCDFTCAKYCRGPRGLAMVPSRPPAGKTRICVTGMGVSPFAGLAVKIAETIVAKFPDKYEYWCWVDNVYFQSHLEGIKRDVACLTEEDLKKFENHITSPFCWIVTEEGVTGIGECTDLKNWAREQFPDDADIKVLVDAKVGLSGTGFSWRSGIYDLQFEPLTDKKKKNEMKAQYVQDRFGWNIDLDPDEITLLENVFKDIDQNNNGTICLKELTDADEHGGLAFFADIDENDAKFERKEKLLKLLEKTDANKDMRSLYWNSKLGMRNQMKKPESSKRMFFGDVNR